MEKQKIFLLLGVFWLVIIGGFVAIKEFTLRNGLKTRPVDPRDLFRGDYVILSYDISRVNTGITENFKNGDKVYVALDIQKNYAVAVGAYATPPQDKLFIKGVVIQSGANSLQVEYGIESYFVLEGKGTTLERRNGKSLEAKVMVDKSGTAIIKELLLDGKTVSFK
jgi:uncharacterized membrane-anchored protein